MTQKTAITSQQLRDLGIMLSSERQEKLLETLQAELEERIGETITTLLDDASLEELIKLTSNGDSKAVNEWVALHIPDYEQVMQDEYDILLGEVAENADKLNTSSK